MSLLVTATVALAQDPAPAPASTPVPAVTAVPSPAATVLSTPTAAPTVALTPQPTVTVAPSPSATATAAPTQTAAPTATPEHREPPRQAATPTPSPSPDPQAEPGATLTICHALGDGTYESVSVVVSESEFNEHFDHDDDIIPAPAAGCGPGAQPDDLVGVCHATGDPEQPYVFAGFKNPIDLEGHESHPGDLIPAPNGTCPGLAGYFVPTPTPTPTPTPSPSPAPTVTPAPTQVETVEPTATAEVIDEDDAGRDRSGGSRPDGMVAGVASRTATADPAARLPFTGFELWLVAAAGLGLVMMGSGLRLLAVQPAVGVTR